MLKIGNILPSLFCNLGIEDAVRLKFLREKWNSIFSHPITEHTFPRDLKNKTLIVTVNSHAWLNELNLLKEDFVKKLHSYGIENVEFRFGRIYKNMAQTDKKHNVSLSKEQKEWMNQTLKKIKDDEIKSITESMIKKYLVFINQIENK